MKYPSVTFQHPVNVNRRETTGIVGGNRDREGTAYNLRVSLVHGVLTVVQPYTEYAYIILIARGSTGCRSNEQRPLHSQCAR